MHQNSKTAKQKYRHIHKYGIINRHNHHGVTAVTLDHLRENWFLTF